MTNNDVLRRIRYAFDFSDDKMIGLFALAEQMVTREEISAWMKKDDDPALRPMSDRQLALFLNGLIIDRRGRQEGALPEPEVRLNNNIILRKLKIALNLQESDMLEIVALAGRDMSKPELSAFFRRPGHKHHRDCMDQVLRNFLQGVQMRFRAGQQGSKASGNRSADKAPAAKRRQPAKATPSGPVFTWKRDKD